MNRKFFIRRGRNNRIFCKAIQNEIFDYSESEQEDNQHFYGYKNHTSSMLKKRKRPKYRNQIEFLYRDKPYLLPYMGAGILSNKKIMRKRFRKLAKF